MILSQTYTKESQVSQSRQRLMEIEVETSVGIRQLWEQHEAAERLREKVHSSVTWTPKQRKWQGFLSTVSNLGVLTSVVADSFIIQHSHEKGKQVEAKDVLLLASSTLDLLALEWRFG